MITGLILLPVLAVLVWLYWCLLPERRWKMSDSIALAAVLVASLMFIGWMEGKEIPGAGPIWSFVVAATGAYFIIAIGLSVALYLRRRH
ncbi:hypothetical protein [Elongatibacter sediminis]|uniref:Uncharacterized protein n=1 Tax=Elongatibacter sediminis TaxID=3119006 RepID=A0AAW9RAK9_9GAMM